VSGEPIGEARTGGRELVVASCETAKKEVGRWEWDQVSRSVELVSSRSGGDSGCWFSGWRV
jgi:hypothetical protein